MCLVGSILYVLGGYAGSSSHGTKYFKDCWCTDLSWTSGLQPAAAVPSPQQQQQQQYQLPFAAAAGQQHQGTSPAPSGKGGVKRQLPLEREGGSGRQAVALTAAAGAAAVGAGPVRAGSGGAAAAAAAAVVTGASTWRSSKRHRAGTAQIGSEGDQAREVQQQQQQLKPRSPFMQQQQVQLGGALHDARVPSPFATRGPEVGIAPESMVGLGVGPLAAAGGGGRRTGCPMCNGGHLDGYVTCPSPTRSGAFECTHEVSVVRAWMGGGALEGGRF